MCVSTPRLSPRESDGDAAACDDDPGLEDVLPDPRRRREGWPQREVVKMLNLSSRLSKVPAVRGRAPWLNHEYVKGWGVFGLPFDSDQVLALRVFPENDFAP